MLNFGLDVLVDQDLVPYLMQLIKSIAAKLEDLVETRKVLKAIFKIDGYHQA